MVIQCDTREKKREVERIEQQFDALGIQHYRSKLYVGDYMNMDNPYLVIDRKKNIDEIYSNVIQGHQRFVDEIQRANAINVKLIILCEHGNGVKELTDVLWWENKRRKRYRGFKGADGKTVWYKFEGKNRIKVKRPPLNGDELYPRLVKMEREYGIKFLFCEPAETGKKIFELLGGDVSG